MRLICYTVLLLLPISFIYTMDQRILSTTKRMRIEQWLSQQQKADFTEELCLDEPIYPEPLDDKPVKFFICPQPLCFIKHQDFAALARHCLLAHNVYICHCGVHSNDNTLFKIHKLLCKIR